MSKKWIQAAVRYEMAKKPGFKPRKKRVKAEEPVPSLAEFMVSLEGRAAKALLSATGRYILLGESETAMSMTTSVSLDGEGLKKSTQAVGMAAVYTKEKPKMAKIGVDEALELLENMKNPADTSFYFHPVLALRKELDQIADEAP